MLPQFVRSPVFQSVAVFLGSLGWCAAFIAWDGFADPDAYYHGKISSWIWLHGPFQAFPWLDLTELATHPADLHFAFHLFVAPFTAIFGSLDGLRVAVILLAAMFLTTFFFALRSLKVPYALVWTALLAATPPFLLRLLLAKATPLALLWFILGLAAAHLRKPWLVALATFGFALSHGGWIVLAGSVVLLAFGEFLFFRLIEDANWKEAIRRTLWRESIAGFAGGALGLLVHPNFPQNLLLSYTQVVTIGLGTPFKHVILGNEWLPTDPGALLTNYAAWAILILLGLFGIGFAAKQPLDKNRARLLTSLGWILAVLVALTLKSRRSTEYLAPVVALWTATLWSLVDLPRLRSVISSAFKRIHIVSGIIVVCLVAVLVNGLWGTFESLHAEDLTSDDVYADSMKAISERAAPGDRVFHTSWDEFPMLFAQDDRLRYIAGLDPTFLYVASSTLSDAVKEATWGVTSTTKDAIWTVVHDLTESKFVFVSLPRHQQFYDIVSLDQRYLPLYTASSSATFAVQP